MDELVNYYESCFDQHGDSHKGVDWPNAKDAKIRYEIMLEGLKVNTNSNRISILDYGCGLGHFLEYLQGKTIYSKLHYEGCDASEKMIRHCQKKFGNSIFFKCSSDGNMKSQLLYDYIICNGVFTEKRNYTHEKMTYLTKKLLQRLSYKCSKGIIVNFMSKNVDWERDDLFHVSLDEITAFLTKTISRHFIVRSDYSLYDFTIYIYNKPFHLSSRCKF